jgi:hypothetical protein
LADNAYLIADVSADLNDAKFSVLWQTVKLAMKEKQDGRYHLHLVVAFECGVILNAM